MVDWENEARRAEGSGVRVVIFRTGLVLDPDGGLVKQLAMPFKLGVGGPLAGGDFYMPWIHRDDEVGLILWALDNPAVSGTLNATPLTRSPTASSQRRSAKRCTGRRSCPSPGFALMAMRGEELTEQIVGSYRVIPRRAQDLGYEFRFTEVGAALDDLV